MKDISNTSERVQFALKQMRKVMPSVKKQVAVYERNVALGKIKKQYLLKSDTALDNLKL